MKYDFSEFFKDNSEEILNEFVDKYTTLINLEDTQTHELIKQYKLILNTFSTAFEEDKILNLFEDLAKHEALLEHPYVIMTNEIYCLQSLLTKKVVSVNSNVNILDFFNLFNKVNNKVADIYLNRYITHLLSLNDVRIKSIADLINKNIIKHYEAHLEWLSKLAIYIQDPKSNQKPELDEKLCNFGKWLKTDANSIINNDSKYNTIISLHSKLHVFGEKIQQHLDKNEEHILITYLEKCELLSLSIGTELALIDNIIMNKKVTRDELTGAMNRHGLESVFKNQYDLSLATGNTFILAMCDLDFFKKINDTYGHVSGDKMLKLFVEVCEHHLRNSDIIIRYGGEEFVIILPAISKAKGYDVLENIRKEFQDSFLMIDDAKLNTTVSIGLVEVKPENYYQNIFLNEYINIADKKLYDAKENGRNKVKAC